MTRKKRGAKKPGGKKPQSVLSDHLPQGRKRVPPLMQFPLTEVSWHEDMLPDFLWVALMLGRRTDWKAAASALDVIDRFVPADSPAIVDGRLSTLAFVPEERRAEARSALRREAPHALPTAFGHAVGLYPSCPAEWLYADWFEGHEVEPEVGVPLVRSLVTDHTDKSGVRESRLRIFTLVRQIQQGKLKFGADSSLTLLPCYPHRLSVDEQRMIESSMRAAWAGFLGVEHARGVDPSPWPKEFWRRGLELTHCKTPSFDRGEIPMPEEDGPLDPEPLMQVSEMAAILRALEDLGGEFRDLQDEIVQDPDLDTPNAVLLGLASRMFRLLYAFLERPSAWVPDVSPFHLRPLVDGRIVIGWLIHRDDPEMFASFREHGLGRLKLLREHIKADFGADIDDDAREYLDYLNARVNLERDEWFQPVNLGSFADVSPRDMAIEADLKREYDLAYAPMSSENHGEWPALRDYDTVLCSEPIHGNHRVGAFQPPSRSLNNASPLFALDLARDGVSQVFGYYGRDISPMFKPLGDSVRAALFDSGD